MFSSSVPRITAAPCFQTLALCLSAVATHTQNIPWNKSPFAFASPFVIEHSIASCHETLQLLTFRLDLFGFVLLQHMLKASRGTIARLFSYLAFLTLLFVHCFTGLIHVSSSRAVWLFDCNCCSQFFVLFLLHADEESKTSQKNATRTMRCFLTVCLTYLQQWICLR